MEEKVQSTLKLIEEDGDSFAKRAEMYYKKRPELIFFVQESYRAYRALAERYDHISTELQNANNALATVFPEQVQFAMDDEDDYGSPRVPPKIVSQAPPNNVPKVPKYPTRDLKGLLTSASNKLQAKKSSKAANANKTAPKSGLSKPEALEEIDKLQKEILALQTVKEFVKSSYESGLSKHREIEKQIAEVQERVFSLQDEFRVGKVIEDDEARTLMAEAALKSCEESLAQLQEKQEKSTKEARAEQQRIEDAHEKLESLKHKFLPDLHADEENNYKDESVKAGEKPQSLNSEAGGVTQERQEREASQEKIMAHFEVDSKEPLTVTELAEKIDELVSKVISLETAVSSQTALINRLRTETDELHTQIRTLEDDKATLIDGTNTLTNRLREMEEKWKGLQDLNQHAENQNNHLQRHFTEARHGLDQLSHKLHNVKPGEELESMESLQEEEKPSVEVKMSAVLEKQEDMPSPGDGSMNSRGLKGAVLGEDKNEQVLSNNQGEKEEQKVSQRLLNNDGYTTISGKRDYTKSLDKVDKHGVSQTADNFVHTTAPQEVVIEKDDEPNWQEMLLNGLEDREKILLTEYIAILRNYKDVKKKLSDVEKKNRDSLFDTTVQLREKSSIIAKRDEEILSLRQKLNLLQGSFSEDKDLKEANRPISVPLENQNAKPDAAEINAALEIPLAKKEEDGVKLILMDQQPQSISPTEEKLRMSIDALLDENLDFWLRFSTSFHQVQKFKTGVQDLQAEIAKLEEKEKLNQEGSAAATTDIKSDVRPLYKHLREIQTELTVWIEKSAVLKEELQRRFSSLCNIQEEISRALKAGAEEEEMKFTSHEAAKFQGEVLNMKQENNKVRDELQAGLDHITALQQEIEKTVAKLNNEFGLSGSGNNNQPQLRNSMSRSRVPLRSFIFGTKPKKKSSIFSCMHHRKYQDLRAGLPM